MYFSSNLQWSRSRERKVKLSRVRIVQVMHDGRTRGRRVIAVMDHMIENR